jgi:phytoene dehydrogenase-like protein
MKPDFDAIVVGSGPNGLAAAITVAESGGSVLILERAEKVGGGVRTSELTLPGYHHDVCSAVYPLGIASPFFRSLPLEKYGLEWIRSPIELAHPLDDGPAVTLESSVERTAAGLGEDAQAYLDFVSPLAENADELLNAVLHPLLRVPEHPLLLARFGLKAIRSVEHLVRHHFRGARASALFAGLAGHSLIPLSQAGSSAIALTLLLAAHRRGWPIPRGGARSLSGSLVAYFLSLGGKIQTGTPVSRLEDLPSSRWVFLDLTPRQFVKIAGTRLSEAGKRRYEAFRYGDGVFKTDFALAAPIPWRDPVCARAATVHLGGLFPEIAESERLVHGGRVSVSPYVLLSQPSLFDPGRAPPGRHTVWAYCHVPHGSDENRADAIENQIERFAPGFRARILARSTRTARDIETYNPNYIGGDIGGGATDLRQMIFRPRVTLAPYATPLKGVYLCSSSTSPGPGVHGMCGHLAALAARKENR